MKRALIISATAHLTILIVLWQVSLTLSRPVMRGYPRLMTARLVAKPGAAPASAPAQSEPPAAVAATPEPKPEPKLVAETKTPAKVVTPSKPPTKKLPETKPKTAGSSGTGGTSNKSAGAGGSSAGGGNAIKIDAPDFPFPYYLVSVQNQIERHWQAPPGGQGERVATVYFKISRDGEIEDVKVEQTSGNALFDQAAMRAVYYANPLPALPAGSGLESLGVHFDFVAY